MSNMEHHCSISSLYYRTGVKDLFLHVYVSRFVAGNNRVYFLVPPCLSSKSYDMLTQYIIILSTAVQWFYSILSSVVNSFALYKALLSYLIEFPIFLSPMTTSEETDGIYFTMNKSIVRLLDRME